MEEKYYFISYLWSDLGNNFHCDAINIHPIDWLVRVNKSYYTYTDEKGKQKQVMNTKEFRLINWIEITKEQFENIHDPHRARNWAARKNLDLSYGKNPF